MQMKHWTLFWKEGTNLVSQILITVIKKWKRWLILHLTSFTAQKMKLSIKDFLSKCDQIRRTLKKSLMENFILCALIGETDKDDSIDSIENHNHDQSDDIGSEQYQITEFSATDTSDDVKTFDAEEENDEGNNV